MLSRRRFVIASMATACAAFTGCGMLLHPERRGQQSGQLDRKIVILDGIGLLLFLVPGIIAFAVDFHQGTIYLPPGQQYGMTDPGQNERLLSRQFPPNQLDQAKVEQVVSDHLGSPFQLTPGDYYTEELDHIDNFWQRQRELRAS